MAFNGAGPASVATDSEARENVGTGKRDIQPPKPAATRKQGAEYFAAHRRGLSPFRAALVRAEQLAGQRPTPSLPNIRFLDGGDV
jgi:hypothetical protein